MEHELKAAADYARCSQIWQRVAPDLDPYPSDSPAPLPAARRRPPAPQLRSTAPPHSSRGAESRCAFLRCARCAPSAAARRAMQLFAREEGAHARRLQSVHYLLTGPLPAARRAGPRAAPVAGGAAHALGTPPAARPSPIAARRRRRRTRRSPPFSAHSRTDETRRADRLLQLLEQSLA